MAQSLESLTLSHFGNWGAAITWIILFGAFFIFLPYHKKSKTKPDKIYLAFIVASAFEMFGIPLSLYFIAWALGINAPVGIFWGHTFSYIFGLQSMLIGYILNAIGGVLIILGWKEIFTKYWGKPKNNRQLVTGGIYTFSRHPQYLGFILMTFGLLVHWATLPLLIMWPIMVYRYYTLARREEKEMLNEFGRTYEKYLAQTPMFFGLPKGSLRSSQESIITDRGRFKIRATVSAFGLLSIYMIVLTIGNSLNHAFLEIIKWWPFLTIQLLGFGLQASMYLYMRERQKMMTWNGQVSPMAMSSGVSATTMVACCLHHVTELLPIVSFSAATLLLSSYQYVFMSVGVLSNILGVVIMLIQMQKYDTTLLGRKNARILSSYDLEKTRNITIFASVAIITILSAAAFGVTPFSDNKTKLIEVSDTRNGITFSFQQIESDTALAFETSFDTHEGSFSFDMVDVVTIVSGNQMTAPIKWDGDPSGGHHIKGVLIFPIVTLNEDTKLLINGVNGFSDWIIEMGVSSAVNSVSLFSISWIAITSLSALFIVLRSKDPFYRRSSFKHRI
jgi:protein-S-isoprenylcysteine O-methyltransferase Ste14